MLLEPSAIDVFKNRKVVLIIEDADGCLAPRQSDNIRSISALLNLGDGLLGSTLNVRVIATTNAKKFELDPALLRPGRLCCHIEVPLLKPDHANRVFSRIASRSRPEPYTSDVSLATVYEDVYMAIQ